MVKVSVLLVSLSICFSTLTFGQANQPGPEPSGGDLNLTGNVCPDCLIQISVYAPSPILNLQSLEVDQQLSPVQSQNSSGGKINGPIYPSDFIFHKTVHDKHQSKLCMPSTQGWVVCAPVGDWIDADWFSTRIAAAAGIVNLTRWGFVQSAAIRKVVQLATITAIGKGKEILRTAQSLVLDSETLTDTFRSGELPGATAADVNSSITAANEAQPAIDEFSAAIQASEKSMLLGEANAGTLGNLGPLQTTVQMHIQNMQNTNPFIGPRMVGGNFFTH